MPSYFFALLPQAEGPLFLGLFRSISSEILHIGRLIILRELGHRYAYLARPRSFLRLLSRPVEAVAISKNGDALLLLVAARCIFLVRLEPALILGTLDVGIVPGSTSLHVGNVLDLELSAGHPFLGIHHRQEVAGLSPLQRLLEALERPALESLGTEPAQILRLLLLLLLGLEFLPGFLGETTRYVLKDGGGRSLACGYRREMRRLGRNECRRSGNGGEDNGSGQGKGPHGWHC
mmetsp:Transcript_15409/g.25674  ORF Transcript_15409/g.25674 Transcript_15409/m.25674 type:complete len:234 (+) Transcript_15409:914-1615(+)